MKLLLDTHPLIWIITNDPKLSNKARTEIDNLVDNDLYVSVVSIWEISIKQSLDRLEGVPNNLMSILNTLPIQLLPITGEHAFAVRDLPLIHKDPFDRMLIVQSQIEYLTLITHDKIIQKYDVPILQA